MALDYDAINLSQGFPDFDTDPVLIDLVTKAMKDGYNQYAPLPGIYSLREQISQMIGNLHGKTYDPESEITISVGASEALFCAITAFVHQDDEVILLKPAYDIYEPAIALQGAKPVSVQMEAPYTSINWDAVKQKISSRTRMIVINTPHNPSGMMFSKNDMQQLENLVKDTDILVLSDEVYEHMAYDSREHESAARFPHLAERALITGSFGKTFHITGWKMGYCLAPKALTTDFRKVHQLNVFCVQHPVQRAMAEYLKNDQNYLNLGRFYQQKRDFFNEKISASRFKFVPTQGSYFQLLDYSAITDEPDTAFAERLTQEHGVASIPVSVFNKDGKDDKYLRFCFAKSDETLAKAAEILNAI